MNKRGEIKQLRVYDKQGKVKMDIDWQHPFEGHPVGTVHSHKWKGSNRTLGHSPLTRSEIYKSRWCNYFSGHFTFIKNFFSVTKHQKTVLPKKIKIIKIHK